MKNSAHNKKIPLWKKIQEEKKKKKTLRISGLLFLILFSTLVFKGLKFFLVKITSPLEDPKCFSRKTDLKRTNRVNIIFDEEPLLIFSFDRAEHTIAALVIPKDFYLKKETEVYRLGSFFELGEMRDGCGGRFLKKELLRFLALPTDRYVKVAKDGWSVDSQERLVAGISEIQSWGWLTEAIFGLRGERNGFRTDLSPGEVLKLWWEAKKVRPDKISFWRLNRGIALQEDHLVDGTPIFVVAGDLFFEETVGLFRDSLLEREGVEVAVFNTTGSQGLGERGGCVVAHLGAGLTHVGNWPEKIETTQIWVVKKEAASSATLRRLSDVFQARVTSKPGLAEPRGELMILLGQDWP